MDDSTGEKIELDLDIAESVDLVFSWLEDDWAEANMKSQDFEDYPNRYGIGSYGEHELTHSLYMMQSNWDTFILTHPSLTINKRDFILAKTIEHMISSLYHKIASREADKKYESTKSIDSTTSVAAKENLEHINPA